MKPLKIRITCPDCGVLIGEHHKRGCDIERCPLFGCQMLQDECIYGFFNIDVATMPQKHPQIFTHDLPDELCEAYEEFLRPHLLVWDGVWPGVRECREYGFWCRWTDDGWQPCGPNDPRAQEDLNELALRTVWDRKRKRFVLPEAQNQTQRAAPKRARFRQTGTRDQGTGACFVVLKGRDPMYRSSFYRTLLHRLFRIINLLLLCVTIPPVAISPKEYIVPTPAEEDWICCACRCPARYQLRKNFWGREGYAVVGLCTVHALGTRRARQRKERCHAR